MCNRTPTQSPGSRSYLKGYLGTSALLHSRAKDEVSSPARELENQVTRPIHSGVHAESGEIREEAAPPLHVLNRLQEPGLSESERQQLIIECEILDFTADQADSLTPLLRQFIDDRRESNERSDLVAVASAIRKFVATARTEEAFNYAASLLRPSGARRFPSSWSLKSPRWWSGS